MTDDEMNGDQQPGRTPAPGPADRTRPATLGDPGMPSAGRRPGPDADSRPGSEADPRPGLEAAAQPGPDADSRPGSEADARGPDAGPWPGSEADPGPGVEADSRPSSETAVQPGPEADLWPGSDAAARPVSEADPWPGAEPSGVGAEVPLDPHAPLSADGPTVRLSGAVPPLADDDPPGGHDAEPADEAAADGDEPTALSGTVGPGDEPTTLLTPPAAADQEPAAKPRTPDGGATMRLQPPFFAPGTTRTPRADQAPARREPHRDPADDAPDRPQGAAPWRDDPAPERPGAPPAGADVPERPDAAQAGADVPDRADDGAAGEAAARDVVLREERAAGVPEKAAPGRRFSSAGALIWVLLALLGFTLVVQLQSNDDDAGLATARQEDLVGILSDLEARDQRLQQEINALEESQRQLTSGVAGRQAALAEAGKRADELGLLSGTLPARGPGLKISIDPRGQPIKASAILNAVQELRGAGGEVMEIIGDNGVAVRIVASSYFVDADGGQVLVDGKQLSGPYTLWVIGVPSTMQTALQIPGGVVASVSQAGGNVTMEQRSTVEVAAVRQPTSLQYARPVS